MDRTQDDAQHPAAVSGAASGAIAPQYSGIGIERVKQFGHRFLGEVSKMERRTELYVGTLRKFIEAMNGERRFLPHIHAETRSMKSACSNRTARSNSRRSSSHVARNEDVARPNDWMPFS